MISAADFPRFVSRIDSLRDARAMKPELRDKVRAWIEAPPPELADEALRLHQETSSVVAAAEELIDGSCDAYWARRPETNAAIEAVLAAAGAWPSPAPLTALGSLPSFPLDSLPTWLLDWITAVATATQTPVDMAAMFALGAAAAAVAKRYEVYVRPDWREPLNLFVLVAMNPGERKSAVHRAAVAPILERERFLARELTPEIRVATEARALLEAKLRSTRARAASATTKPGDREAAEREINEIAAKLGTARVPPVPQLVADDVTPEALARLLAEQGGRMAVMSAEGGLLDIVAGRYSDGGAPNLDVLLKGHAGDPLRVGRIGRERNDVLAPALTLVLAVQLDVLRGLARRPHFRGRGLLARFLYSLPTSIVGRRDPRPPSVPPDVEAAYGRGLESLLQLPDRRNAEGEYDPSPLTFSGAARERFERFLADLEPRLGTDASGRVGDLAPIADWASKLAGAVARIAGVLTLRRQIGPGFEHFERFEAGGRVVDLADVEAAVRIGKYLLEHARAAFDAMGAGPVVDVALDVVRWLAGRWRRDGVTRRDVQQAMRSRFAGASGRTLLDEVLLLLVDHGFLRPVEAARTAKTGRLPGPAYDVNPTWRLGWPQATESLPGALGRARLGPAQNAQDDPTEDSRPPGCVP